MGSEACSLDCARFTIAKHVDVSVESAACARTECIYGGVEHSSVKDPAGLAKKTRLNGVAHETTFKG